VLLKTVYVAMHVTTGLCGHVAEEKMEVGAEEPCNENPFP
jgi:hypothetical protein